MCDRNQRIGMGLTEDLKDFLVIIASWIFKLYVLNRNVSKHQTPQELCKKILSSLLFVFSLIPGGPSLFHCFSVIHLSRTLEQTHPSFQVGVFQFHQGVAGPVEWCFLED